MFLLLALNKQNPGWVVRTTLSKNLDISNTLQLKVVNNFDKNLHFKVYYGMLNLPRVFFHIYISLEVLLLV